MACVQFEGEEPSKHRREANHDLTSLTLQERAYRVHVLPPCLMEHPGNKLQSETDCDSADGPCLADPREDRSDDERDERCDFHVLSSYFFLDLPALFMAMAMACF